MKSNNIPKKFWWKCQICEKLIKDKYPLKVGNGKTCAIYNPIFNCPEYLKSKYEHS